MYITYGYRIGSANGRVKSRIYDCLFVFAHPDARTWKNASMSWREKFLPWKTRKHRTWTFCEALWNTSRWAWVCFFGRALTVKALVCLKVSAIIVWVNLNLKRLLCRMWTSLGITRIFRSDKCSALVSTFTPCWYGDKFCFRRDRVSQCFWSFVRNFSD